MNDSTAIALRTILGSRQLKNEYVFALIGPADNRTRDDAHAATRFAELTCEIVEVWRRKQDAYPLVALSLAGRLDEIDWEALVAAVSEAARPPHDSRFTRRRRRGQRVDLPG